MMRNYVAIPGLRRLFNMLDYKLMNKLSLHNAILYLSELEIPSYFSEIAYCTQVND